VLQAWPHFRVADRSGANSLFDGCAAVSFDIGVDRIGADRIGDEPERSP